MKFGRIFLSFVLVGAVLAVLAPLRATATDVSFAFQLNAAGQRLPNIQLVGDGSTVSACTIVVTSGSLFTLVPQYSPDASTWHTATTVGGGSITAAGTYGPGNIPVNDGAGHNTVYFGGVLSSFTAGSVRGTETCTNAVFPSPTPTPSAPPTVIANVGMPTVIPACPSTEPVTPPSGYYTCVIASDGTLRTHDYTPVQPSPLYTVPVHDAAPVQPSPLYTQPVSGTVSNNCLSNCTPTPTTPQFVHPDGTPFPISGSVTALVSPSPFATFSPYPAGAVVLTGPSTAPAASAGAYMVCVDSSGKLCVQTPAPAATGAHGGVVIEGVASGTAVTVSGTVTCPTCPTAAPTGNQTVHNDGTFAGATAVPGTTPIPYPTGAGGTLVAAHTRGNSIILTSSSAHSCTSLAVGAFPLVVIDNVGAGTTVFPQFFDEAGSPTCAAADAIFGDGSTITLGPAQIISLFQGVKNGIAYSASGALSSNLVVGW